jgi:peptidoglycan/LPS O-acetylase OafA/YrhL
VRVAGRLTPLDGLRGYAALVVVVGHVFCVSPALLADTVGLVAAPRWSLGWWLADTPLRLLSAGDVAVFVFFVLSGLVLVRPVFVRGGDWLAYYPSRLVRLYLPSAVAVLLAALWTVLVARHPVAHASWWLNSHPQATVSETTREVSLQQGASALDTPLWSLRYEVQFSLLLPAYAGLAFLIRRSRVLAVVTGLLLLALTGYGASRFDQGMTFLPMFGLGALLAAHVDDAVEFIRRAPRSAAALAVLLLSAEPLLKAAGPHRRLVPLFATGVALEAGGAALLVCVCLAGGPVRRACDSRPGQWLGRRSFSLYLTHEPLVVSFALLLGGRPDTLLLLLVSVPASLLLAEVFFRLVEAPSHRGSQRLRQVVREHTGRRALAGASVVARG